MHVPHDKPLDEKLAAQFEDALATVEAIRQGKVDAFFVSERDVDQILVLDGCDAPYRLLVERMQSGAATLTADGTIFYHNQAFAGLVGDGSESCTGQSIYSLVLAADSDRLRNAIEENQGGGCEIEVTILQSGGESFPALITANNLMGNNDAVCIIVTDLTQQRMHEEERLRFQREKDSRMEAERTATILTAAKDKLEQQVADRTVALRKLAVELVQTEQRERRRLQEIMHNDVQQLLIALKTQAALAREQPERLEEIARLTDMVIASCRDLTLNLYPPLLHGTNLATIFEWLVNHLKAQNGLVTDLTIHGQIPELEEEVRTIVFEAARELLLNVIKHANVSNAKLVLNVQGGRLCIEVSDNGKGCNPSVLDRPAGDSYGLFSIHERIRLFGGEINIQSEPGHGCTVRFSVPVAMPGQSEWPNARANGADRTQGHESTVTRLLVADDHEVVRHALVELLSTQPGFVVVGEACDGEEAVQMARELQPDIVLIDVYMPKLNGVAATRLIRHDLPDCRIIGLSMHPADLMARTLLDAGGTAYLNKAVSIDELLSAIRAGT